LSGASRGGSPLKANEFVYLLGLKPKPRTYGFAIEAHDLAREGRALVRELVTPANLMQWNVYDVFCVPKD